MMRRSAIRISVGLFAFFLLLCMGLLGLPLDVAIAIVFGWIFYLMRVLPEVHVNWWGVATAIASLVPLALGSQLFLAWFCRVTAEAKGIESRRWRWRWTGGLVAMVVLMFVAGLAAGGIAHQVGWLISSPEPWVSSDSSGAANRAQSTNNLKQIGLALYNYESTFGTFPPSGIFDPRGRPLHSWQAMILPDVEQKELFDQINFTIPWDDARNLSPMRARVYSYVNPGMRIYAYKHPGVIEEENSAGYALSHYAGNVHMLGGDTRRAVKDVTDGTANTLMAGEVVSRFKPWGDPTNWRDPALGIDRSPDGFGSPFVGGANFLMVDGSVRFIKKTIAPGVLKGLSTPSGGEQVSSEQY
jgi:prepilin-type processing-associated H-X9-DG protein